MNMQREIKFRYWDENWKKMRQVSNLNLETLPDSEVQVMQYAGLKDKNGKEIFEGDIIKKVANVDEPSFKLWHETIEPIAAVKYKHGGFFVGNSANDGIFLSSINDKVEIIGNIYESPELLTNKKD